MSCVPLPGVMDVEIDDQHAVQPMPPDGRHRANGHVVEETKAHCPVGQCVVPRWADEAQARSG